MATEFRSEVAKGPGFSDAELWDMVADDANITLWGPVVLGTGTVADLPRAASTTITGDAAVIGVCVAFPQDGLIIADVSVIQVCTHGRSKVKVNNASVALNDPLETFTTAGEAAVQADPTVDITDATTVGADLVIIANNIRSCFAIALSTSANANSIVACYVNINPCRGDVT